ncbi:uncharacterized protein [Chelonus insularis]|uniref:uncharacterized protein isoform X2 n=1 Tax=Chelonus insularis TaxID=460826 RepID=UPI00158BD867|nr:uncharacterized protein LOC118068419 isoform X2 [Chelonus insularis]
MQKPLRELSRLCLGTSGQNNAVVVTADVCTEPPSGLPLLQVWPSESPRGEGDGQAFIFPDTHQDSINDSGIESIQASPSPCGAACSSVAVSPQQSRRPSLLHPDHARLHLYHLRHNHGAADRSPQSPDRNSIDEEQAPPAPPSPSSSTSSLRSMPSSTMASVHSTHDRRRSSRYSVFDALDLEYALLRAAARGSVGPYSLSESLHKLTFTQSLAFPALARGLASKQSVPTRRPQQHSESGLNAFAKVVTALVLMLVSVLVFGIVYKFVRT